MKYSNLHEVVSAFASGELDRAAYRLHIADDCSQLVYCGPVPTEAKESPSEADAWLERKQAEVCEWFRGYGHSGHSAAFLIANAPAEFY